MYILSFKTIQITRISLAAYVYLGTKKEQLVVEQTTGRLSGFFFLIENDFNPRVRTVHSSTYSDATASS